MPVISFSDFVAGALIKASEMNTKLNLIKNLLNGNLDYDNIKDNGVTGDKMAATGTSTKVFHNGGGIALVDTGGFYTTDTVEGALAQVGAIAGTGGSAVETKSVITATDSWPVTVAHGITGVPKVAVMLRGKASTSTYGMYFNAGAMFGYSNGTNAAWTSFNVLVDSTNVIITARSTDNFNTPYDHAFSAATKTYFYLPNSSGALVNTWDTIEGTIFISGQKI